MKYIDIFKEENEQAQERYSLIVDRIKSILDETTVEEIYRDYFRKTASFLMLIDEVVNLVKEDKLKELSLE